MTLDAFRALGVQPILGRGFQAGDDLPGASSVVLLGHDLWRERYGGAPDIVGRTIRANSTQLTVIGVMPPQFAFPIRESLWLPLRADPLAMVGEDGARGLLVRRRRCRLQREVAREQSGGGDELLATGLELPH